MPEEQDDIEAREHNVVRASNGSGWDVELLDPDGDRKHVRVKVLRVRDFRKVVEFEKAGDAEGAEIASVVCEFIAEFTDLTIEDVESLSMDDLYGIREVIRRQLKKLTAG